MGWAGVRRHLDAVIVTQVAATLMFPAAAFFLRQHVVHMQHFDVAFADSEFSSARSDRDPGSSRDSLRELEQRLAAEPTVAGVAFASRLPRSQCR